MMILVHEKDFFDVDVRWSREYIPIDIIDAPSTAQYSQDEPIETSEEEDVFDDIRIGWKLKNN